MFSINGAQLYRNKVSDCWLLIWVILDRSPETRYKKDSVLPGVIIPGPNKPKNIDSFLFPGFHHIVAIHHEGLVIWDTDRNVKYKSNLFLVIVTSDGPGLAYLNGLVGHHGKNGCRLYCGMPGCHKQGGSIYYPVMLKPNAQASKSTSQTNLSDHADVDPEYFACSAQVYMQNLAKVIQSQNDAQYRW